MAGVTRNPRPLFVTALPAAPSDGQEIFYQSTVAGTGGGSSSMADVGAVWHLRYRSAATGSYKWEFIGGAPVSAETTSSGTRTATTYGDLSANTQELTVPLAGDYRFDFYMTGTVDTDAGAAIMALKFGGTLASDTYQAGIATPGSGVTSTASRFVVWPNLSVSSAVRAQFRKGAAGVTATFARHGLSAQPIRVG